MAPIWNLWSSFGVAQARFLPYWESQEWLAAAPEGVKVSAYLRPDGDALIIASNLSEKPSQGELRLKRTILSASDALSPRPVAVRDGAIADEFPVWTARLYRARLKQPTAGKK
jgi:hypothetical protein